jgi:hypothetical protein
MNPSDPNQASIPSNRLGRVRPNWLDDHVSNSDAPVKRSIIIDFADFASTDLKERFGA